MRAGTDIGPSSRKEKGRGLRRAIMVTLLLAIGVWFAVHEFDSNAFERAEPSKATSPPSVVLRKDHPGEAQNSLPASIPQISRGSPSAPRFSKEEENAIQAPPEEVEGADEEEERKPRIGAARFTYDGAFGYSYEKEKDRHAYLIKYFSEQELLDPLACLCVTPTDEISEMETMMRKVVETLQQTKIKGLVFLGDGYGSHRGTWHQREAKQFGRDLRLLEQIKDYPELEVLILDGLDGLYPVTIKDSDFNALGELRSLRALSLNGFLLTESMIDTIAGLTSLEELNLAWCSSDGPDKAGARTLSRLSALVNLRGLSLKNCWFDGLRDPRADKAPSDEAAWRRLEFLSSLDRLERLNMSDLVGIRDRDLKYVSSLKNLRHFRLRGSWNISDVGLAESLAPLRNLETIQVSGANWGRIFSLFTGHLSNPERITGLEVGHFSSSSFDPDFFSFLDSLSRFRNLRELATGYTGSARSYDKLMEKMPVDRVWSLDQLRYLALAFDSSRDLSYDDQFRFFVSRYPLPRLERLVLSGGGITDASVPTILSSLPSLRWIDTSGTGISENGVKSLRARGLEVVDGRDQ